MNANQFVRVLFALASLILIAGCAPVHPIMNITDAPVVANKPSVTLDEVGKAIVRAGAAIGIQMIISTPGHIVGTYAKTDFRAVFDVRYNTRSYSITYKDSQGLKYDGTNIHRQYNVWISNLDRNIRAQLSAI